ncbi:MAG: hypothetical protein JEZ07_04255 [Phycisphaerae bacterium]|nr:hypothetical protein [Phycisphaerae bacterium]
MIFKHKKNTHLQIHLAICLIFSLLILAGCPKYPDYRPNPASPDAGTEDVYNNPVTANKQNPGRPILQNPAQVKSTAKSGEYWILDPSNPEANAQGYVLVSTNSSNHGNVDTTAAGKEPVKTIRTQPGDFQQASQALKIYQEKQGVISKPNETPTNINVTANTNEPDVNKTQYQPNRPIVAYQGASAAGNDKLMANNADMQTNSTQADKTVESEAFSQRVQPVLIRDTSIHQVIADLERLLKDDPKNSYCQTALRTLYSSVGQKAKALELSQAVPGKDDPALVDLATAVVLTLESEKPGATASEATKALKAVEKLSEQLAKQADLEITELKICGPDSHGNSSIKGFGKYDEQRKEYLETGSAQTVWVYCQLDNFTSQLDNSGLYFTKLNASITLYDANYNPIAKLDGEVPDSPISSVRKDFFIQGRLNIPKLSPGKYEIKVEIGDKLANKKAKPEYYSFTVGADESTRTATESTIRQQ